MLNNDRQPILALASAAGVGGIGVIRVSGSNAQIDTLCGLLFPDKVLQPRYAHLLSVRDGDGSVIDRAIVLRFVGPHSYTGEGVLEIQAHGGQAVLQLIMDRVLEVGKPMDLRYANPGEFTFRSFMHGRIDLAQAEAVSDLISASTGNAARAAARSLQGVFSERSDAICREILELRAYIEATLDFPEEEIDFVRDGHVNEKIQDIGAKIDALTRSAMRGKVLRDGLKVILVGSPNVGKSSIMNALAGEDVAIVTDIAGTTRDRISYALNLDGLTVNLVDTAGLRETTDTVERIGIERTLESVRDADVILHLTSLHQQDCCADQQALAMVRQNIREGVTYLRVVNKIDLCEGEMQKQSDILYVSAKTGEGIEQIVRRLKQVAGFGEGAQ
ncbi:MAG: tRNA uridine-5-carboxymethylaminomethyl(34) synthesis GTPase MnmE, partial [Duodenibacillus sp.]